MCINKRLSTSLTRIHFVCCDADTNWDPFENIYRTWRYAWEDESSWVYLKLSRVQLLHLRFLERGFRSGTCLATSRAQFPYLQCKHIMPKMSSSLLETHLSFLNRDGFLHWRINSIWSVVRSFGKQTCNRHRFELNSIACSSPIEREASKNNVEQRKINSFNDEERAERLSSSSSSSSSFSSHWKRRLSILMWLKQDLSDCFAWQADGKS
jgi:hypothetical protein